MWEKAIGSGHEYIPIIKIGKIFSEEKGEPHHFLPPPPYGRKNPVGCNTCATFEVNTSMICIYTSIILTLLNTLDNIQQEYPAPHPSTRALVVLTDNCFIISKQ